MKDVSEKSERQINGDGKMPVNGEWEEGAGTKGTKGTKGWFG